MFETVKLALENEGHVHVELSSGRDLGLSYGKNGGGNTEFKSYSSRPDVLKVDEGDEVHYVNPDQIADVIVE